MKRAPKSPQQQRRAKWESEFARAKKRVRIRSGGRCEFDDGERCEHRATPTHHRLSRKHPRTNELEFLLDLCTPHHDWIHANTGLSYRLGWLVSFDSVPREAA